MESTQDYIPALRYHWLTPFYDPFMRRFFPEGRLHGRLVLEADILPGMRVLDLGCGTGTMTILIKQGHVLSQVYGLDADPQVLGIARSKADQAHAIITLEQGLAYQMPFPDAWFDRVLTSLVFHHLTEEQKQLVLNEVCRVLRPGGKFALLDLGLPYGAYARLVSHVVRHMEQAEANVRGLLPGMIAQAGLANCTEIGHFGTIMGSLSLLRAEKPTIPAA